MVQVQTLAVYRGIAVEPAPLPLPPLPYPRPTFVEAWSPWWLPLPVGILVALRLCSSDFRH